MTMTRFTQGIVLACIGSLAACTSGDGGAAGNTELNVLVPVGSVQSGPGQEDIQSVEYTVNCLGNDDTFLDNDLSFADGVTIQGNLEVVDGRTSFAAGKACNGGDNNGATCAAGAAGQAFCAPGGGTCDKIADFGPNLQNQSEVWQGFMDLPPGPCTVQLRAREADGEVICSAIQGFNILADTTTKVNLILVCDISFQAPVGMLDLDATFEFNVGNFCPDLFVFNAVTSDPLPVPTDASALPLPPALIPDPFLIASTTIEVRFRDGDDGCGENCDPQACTPILNPTDGSLEGIDCNPACQGPPDTCPTEPVTTITCTSLKCDGGVNVDEPCNDDADCPLSTCAAGQNQTALTDCDLNGIPEVPVTPAPVCTLTGTNGDFLGNPPPELIPFPVPGNPNLNASAVVLCTPLPGTPEAAAILNLGIQPGESGAVITCVAVTTDGDEDCNKTKRFDIQCPGFSACDSFGQAQTPPVSGDQACADATGTVCLASSCNDGSCEGTAISCCDNTPVVDGTDCSDEVSGPGECQGGACVQTGCLSDADCTQPAACIQDQTCDVTPGSPTLGSCLPSPPDPEASGFACDAGAGASSGACNGAGACVDICTFNPDCPDPGVECQVATCDPVDGTCGSGPAANGITCDFNPGQADGVCTGGSCVFAPDSCNFVANGDDAIPQTQVVGVGCTNSVTAAQSPFPFVLTVDAPNPILAGQAFSVDLGGQGVFPEFFLDAAQSTVCGGVREAALTAFNSAVTVRSGATGPDVLLPVDLASIVPGPTRFCNFPSDQICTANSECLGGTCNAPINLASVAVIDGIPGSAGGCTADVSGCPGTFPPPVPDCDCSPCAAIDVGGSTVKATQCADNGFCAAGDLIVDFETVTGNYTAEASGDVLFGWFDRVNEGVCQNDGTATCTVDADCPGSACVNILTLCPDPGAACGDAFMVDGCYDLPAAANARPPVPIGVRLVAGGALAVAVQCDMGEDGGECTTAPPASAGTGVGCLTAADCQTGETCEGVGVDDDIICPTPDSGLISCPIN